MRWFVIPVAAAAVALAVWSLTVTDGPGGTAEPASNYRSRITTVEPARAGLEIRSVALGTRLELTNRTGQTVTVLGYNDEPYLRVDRDGVYENVLSPTLYVDGGDAPQEVDAEAAPSWRRVSGGLAVDWHDHRAHWMGSQDPPEVAAQPYRTHLVTPWEIPLQVGDGSVTVSGRLTWVPGPRPWPWFLVVVAAGLLVAGLALSRWRRLALPAALTGLLAVTVTQTAGAWAVTSGGFADRLAVLVLPLLATAPALVALMVGRDDVRNRLLLLGATVAGLGGLVGASRLSWLSHSQLPTDLEPTLARGTVAAGLGLALGDLLVVAWQLRAAWQPPPAGAPPEGSDRLATGAGARVAG